LEAAGDWLGAAEVPEEVLVKKLAPDLYLEKQARRWWAKKQAPSPLVSGWGARRGFQDRRELVRRPDCATLTDARSKIGAWLGEYNQRTAQGSLGLARSASAVPAEYGLVECSLQQLMRVPAKPNADSDGKPNGIPG
jgi:hypothetical protein